MIAPLCRSAVLLLTVPSMVSPTGHVLPIQVVARSSNVPPIMCSAALSSFCDVQRGDNSTCRRCTQANQQELQAAGCSEHGIARWCGGPPPPPRLLFHYEDPNLQGSCQVGEMDAMFENISGKVCSPKCSFLYHHCPTDVPPLVTAKPKCMLQGVGALYCALLCTRSPQGQCGPNATCKTLYENGTKIDTGICTYDS
jgi:hypothetical protein